MINKYGAVDGMRIDRKNQSIGENPPQCHFVHHKSQIPHDLT
jgi:hypothetical protein